MQELAGNDWWVQHIICRHSTFTSRNSTNHCIGPPRQLSLTIHSHFSYYITFFLRLLVSVFVLVTVFVTVYSYARCHAHGFAPDYITWLHWHQLRRASPIFALSTNNIPRTRTRMDDRSLSVAGSRAWNACPADIRCALSLDTFKKRLKSHLFSAVYDP